MKRISIIIYFIFSITQTNAGLFGPTNYEECVLENMRNAKTDLAVNTVHAMCASKFSDKSSRNNQSEIPKQCLLFWNGLKTTLLSKEPNEWRKNYSQYEVLKYGMVVGNVFVPKGIEFNKETESLIYKQVDIYCR